VNIEIVACNRIQGCW